MAETEVIEGEVMSERAIEQWTPKLLITLDEAKRRHDENLEYMKHVLKEGVHYGVIPGTGGKDARRSLLKPGAQSLCRDMGLHPDPVTVEHTLDVDGHDHNGEPFIHYQMKVDIYVTADKVWVGAGVGSCNSWEERYRWRTQVRTCPTCKQPAIIKGKAEYGGGWICFKKQGGCGAKFADGDKAIESQSLGRVPNDRVMDLDNTILKQAAKRALVEAVLNVTGASEVYTQDIDQSDEADDDERARMEASREMNKPNPSSPNRRAAASPPGPAAASPSPTDAERGSSAMTGEHQAAIRAAYKRLHADRHPVIKSGFARFMDAHGGTWSSLWSDDALYAEAADILGLPAGVPESKFDPDAVEAPA